MTDVTSEREIVLFSNLKKEKKDLILESYISTEITSWNECKYIKSTNK